MLPWPLNWITNYYVGKAATDYMSELDYEWAGPPNPNGDSGDGDGNNRSILDRLEDVTKFGIGAATVATLGIAGAIAYSSKGKRR